jgi:uncharacterized membrane protein
VPFVPTEGGITVDALYLWLKFIHIAAIAIWIGGVIGLVVLNARMARAGGGPVMAALGEQSEFFGRSVLGPAMGVALLAGLGTAGVARFPFSSLWIVWGILGFVLSILIGVVAVGRAAAELGSLSASAGPGDARVASARSRLITLNVINILILFSIVWAMVFKPTL